MTSAHAVGRLSTRELRPTVALSPNHPASSNARIIHFVAVRVFANSHSTASHSHIAVAHSHIVAA